MGNSLVIPTLRHHKASGQGVVTLAGRDIYLGKYGSEQAKTKYADLVAQHIAQRGVPRGVRLTVAQLCAAYIANRRLQFAGSKHGPKELHLVTRSVGFAATQGGDLLVDTFGPRTLKQCIASMSAAGFSSRYIARCVNVIRRMFRWGVSEETVQVETLNRLEAVQVGGAGQRRPPRLDVSEADFRATLPHVRFPLHVAVEVQWLTGMRPGELLDMRAGDIDRTLAVWVYRPRSHKCLWRGRGREILLGPRCQELLRPLLDREPDAYVFDPSEAERGSGRPGRYCDRSYIRAIHRACGRAKVQPWAPYALRHAAATRFSAQFGQDAARRLLGHKSVSMTAHYDHCELSGVVELAAKAC